MTKNLCLGLAGLLGILAEANGLFMLLDPEAWYLIVPGVTFTGPFNPHFVRDIGFIFLLLGGLFLAGAARPELRVAFWGTASVWLIGHAMFHLWEVAVGICTPADLVRDFPAVSLPAILGAAITLWAAWDARGAARTPAYAA